MVSQDNLTEQLLRILSERGLASSAELQQLTGKSQPTLSRVLGSLSDRGVVKTGRGRRTRYAMCQPLLGRLPGQQPLWRHDTWGGIDRWGSLTWLASGQVHVEGQGKEWLERGKLPWFLSPLRLEGYLGRRWARHVRLAQVLGPELQHWDVEQQLYAAITQLYDGPGAFTLGSPDGGPAHTVTGAALQGRGQQYDSIADNEAALPLAGSSAAGEQAKFLVDLPAPAGDLHPWQSVIVKFSPAPRGTPFGERWHDLLHAEDLALKVLAEAGQPVASARVLETGKRSYLESVRFDRMNRHGRRHVVALASIHDSFVPGARHHWAASCQALADQGLLSQDDARRVRLWRQFGLLIGNNDMHFGNLSLWVDDPARPRFELAPCYDMLPMVYRPGDQHNAFGLSPLAFDRPVGLDAGLWHEGRELAERFWTRLTGHTGVTPAFRQVAGDNAERLRALR